ncbi:hypothetical protein RFI_38118, partial [Reticulomyxa filosa]
RVLETPNNPISIALTLTCLTTENQKDMTNISKLGSMLFSRCVSGCRIVVPGEKKKIGNFQFDDYGAHITGGYPAPYLTVAAAIGMKQWEINEFIFRLTKCLHSLLKVKKSNLSNFVAQMTIAPSLPI